ncbi:MAG: hypothetical protein AMK72_07810 [Planctomycetes bacterium SM23_25]|nr:MAG: hypothetical protein AMK72_07810 [Planctomycetes bacterium SM23_25]
MPHARQTLVAAVTLLAVSWSTHAATPAKPEGCTPDQARMLAIRAAQVDAVSRLAETVLAARVSAVRTLGQAIGPGSAKEIALRVFLRAAQRVGEPRVYSDGVAEVDVEVPVDAVARQVAALYTPGEHETGDLADLAYVAVDGYVRAGGRGRAPSDPSPEALAGLESVPLEGLPEMFPAGWERVTATGRVEAIRAARIRAYSAMAEHLKGVYLGPKETVGGLVDGLSASEAMFDAFVRSLPVAGPVRMMPDGIAEVDVAVMVPDVIQVLKDIRTLRGAATWTDERIDRLSLRLKSRRLVTTGHGMPPASEVRPADAAVVAGGVALPDWAAETIEAHGEAPFSADMADREEARVLAARSAKVRALSAVAKQVDDVALGDGVTVRQRAATDSRFRRDLTTFLSGVRTVASRPTEDGKGWEVALRLPLLRLYEFSLPHD